MYYNAPPPANSPGLQHKLSSSHDQSIWSRAHHPVLPNPTSTPNQPPGPQSPGYSVYVNGTPGLHHPAQLAHPPPHPHHQHHNSLHQIFHPPTPPSQNTQQVQMRQSSPTSSAQIVGNPHWQSQMIKAEVSPFPYPNSLILTSATTASYVVNQTPHIIVPVLPPWLPEILPKPLSPSRTLTQNHHPYPTPS